MTPEEAKQQLEMAKGIIARLGKDWLDERDYPVLDLAIQALDKQIPPKKNYEEDCPFCKEHEQGDRLFEASDWDNGYGFEFINDIKYCPICGKALQDE